MAGKKATTKANKKRSKASDRPSSASFCEAAARLYLINSMVPERKVPAVLYLSSDDERRNGPSSKTPSKKPSQFRARPRFEPRSSLVPNRQALIPSNSIPPRPGHETALQSSRPPGVPRSCRRPVIHDSEDETSEKGMYLFL
jgi:hypothetical protein